MTRRFMPVLLTTAAALSAAAPAWADYYILRESPAGPCRIVDDRPADGKSIVGGDRSYPDRTLAEKEMPLLCKSQLLRLGLAARFVNAIEQRIAEKRLLDDGHLGFGSTCA